MKQIPNIITAFRIVLCVPLLFSAPLSTWFTSIYIACGLSDVLDGFVARKFDVSSKSGAILDSVADMIFFAVILAKLIPTITLPIWVTCWIIGIAAARLFSLTIGYCKYHELASLHTYANKATGVLLFCFPLFYGWIGIVPAAYIVCGAASLAAVEEAAIIMASKELNRNIKCVFTLKTQWN